ncbi:arpin-like [Sycon ciliatum]|uniref:arpin-like n=1 Tax=Sycon ciliatum TaxID=27933 RepID=UPI0031F71C64
MSRAHMLYDDKPLESGSTAQHHWQGTFTEETASKNDPSDQAPHGVILEAAYQAHEKHYFDDAKKQRYRYWAVHLEFKSAARRTYDKFNQEVEPNLGKTKLQNSGFLNSSYKKVADGSPDTLSYSQVCQLIASKTDLDSWSRPRQANCFVLYLAEDSIKDTALEAGQCLRIRTKANGPFIESFALLDTVEKRAITNYSGGAATGKSWTDNLMAAKQSKAADQLPSESNEGVNDDEWD